MFGQNVTLIKLCRVIYQIVRRSESRDSGNKGFYHTRAVYRVKCQVPFLSDTQRRTLHGE